MFLVFLLFKIENKNRDFGRLRESTFAMGGPILMKFKHNLFLAVITQIK